MPKPSSDPFWPMSLPDSQERISLPKLTSDSASSVISPLTLPRGIAGYFDHVASKAATPTHLHPIPHTSSDAAALYKPRGSQVYSPLSPGARDPPTHPASFLSPQLLPSARQGQLQRDQHRSSSLPPITSPSAAENGSRSKHEMAIGLPSDGWSPVPNKSMQPIHFSLSGYPRSITTDVVSALPQGVMIQRLTEQNAKIRKAWEAERKHLEANRERAEEVYKEERALMEEERTEWEVEKAALLQEIERLRRALGWGGVSPPALNGIHSLPTNSFSNLDQRGGSRGSSRISPNSSLSSQRSPQPGIRGGGPILRNGNSPSPMAAPKILDLASPRSPNGPSAPAADFLKSAEASEAEGDPIPVVDVGEILPGLEGIPIKATSVKKATFTDIGSPSGSKTSSMSGSPPTSSDQTRSPRVKKEQTLQVLAAKEIERLTMHAGHTPNHSLSALATVTSSGTATATSDGGSSTPTMLQEEDTPIQDTTTTGVGDGVSEPAHTTDPFPGATDRHGNLLLDHPEPTLEPSEDRELKGPLMVRNMPAHDEVFFQKLADKLEEVSKGDKAALPAVLQVPAVADTTGNSAEPSKMQAEDQPHPQQEVAGADAGSEGRRSSSTSDGEDDFDVPLKFKKRMNFGAPFGEVR